MKKYFDNAVSRFRRWRAGRLDRLGVAERAKREFSGNDASSATYYRDTTPFDGVGGGTGSG